MFELLCDNYFVLNGLGLGSFLLSFLLDLHCASISSLELLAGESGHHSSTVGVPQHVGGCAAAITEKKIY